MAAPDIAQRPAKKGALRRWLVPGVVFLLLGTVVNVAVAWGCAFWIPIDPDFDLLADEESSSLLQNFYGRQVIGEGVVNGVAVRRAGHTLHIAIVLYPNTKNLRNLGVDQSIAGWPARSLRGYSLSKEAYPEPAVEYIGSVATPEILGLMFGMSKSRHMLPLRALWPGFAINTIFYAVIIWLLFATPFALRRWRRVRKGLCPKCAYPVGANDVCTECGAAVKRISEATNTEEPSP